MKKKSLTLGLALAMTTTVMPAFAAEDVAGGHTVNAHYGQGVTEAEVCAKQTVESDETASCTVYAELSSEFTVTIPKALTLSGTDKTGSYTVSVEGDIAGTEYVNVMPDSFVSLSSKNLDNVTATITQDKQSWGYNEFETSATGQIDAKDITAGAWNGTFNFNINLDNSKKVTVNGKVISYKLLDEEASTEIIDSLLDSEYITEDDYIVIQATANDLYDMADAQITFEVGSIAKEGDKVILTYNDEESGDWYYMDTLTVNNKGTILYYWDSTEE